jgi:hypothetical protein
MKFIVVGLFVFFFVLGVTALSECEVADYVRAAGFPEKYFHFFLS